jgi:hypothetical protein
LSSSLEEHISKTAMETSCFPYDTAVSEPEPSEQMEKLTWRAPASRKSQSLAHRQLPRGIGAGPNAAMPMMHLDIDAVYLF